MEDMNKTIDELTLMLLYLTSWQEYPTEGIRHKPIRTAEKLRLTWKGHDRSALTRLDSAGLVFNDCGKAPIQITQEGETRARELLRKYGISCSDASIIQYPAGGTQMSSKRVCPNCGRKMKQQFIGLFHCKCGVSWKSDIGFFERTPDMVFALERRQAGKKVKQVPIIRQK